MDISPGDSFTWERNKMTPRAPPDSNLGPNDTMNTAVEQRFRRLKLLIFTWLIGAKRAEIAEREMPALTALREHRDAQPWPAFWVAST